MIKRQEFRPTAGMKLYAFQRAKMGVKAANTVISKEIGIGPETISRWKNRKGFELWLEDQVANYRGPILSKLEQIALDNINDFNFWKALAIKYGFIDEKSPEGSLKSITLNYSIDE